MKSIFQMQVCLLESKTDLCMVGARIIQSGQDIVIWKDFAVADMKMNVLIRSSILMKITGRWKFLMGHTTSPSAWATPSMGSQMMEGLFASIIKQSFRNAEGSIRILL